MLEFFIFSGINIFLFVLLKNKYNLRKKQQIRESLILLQDIEKKEQLLKDKLALWQHNQKYIKNMEEEILQVKAAFSAKLLKIEQEEEQFLQEELELYKKQISIQKIPPILKNKIREAVEKNT